MLTHSRAAVLVAATILSSSLLFSTVAQSKSAPSSDHARMITSELEGMVHTSAARPAALARAANDTFYLFGGPGTLEGKFQTADDSADMQGWTGVDLTETPVYWQMSTFNGENLGDHGVGNRAMWCGQSAEQEAGWVTPPGYGNQWDAVLLYESAPLADPSVGQTVSLDFVFNYDTEPAYDYFYVEYDSANAWKTVLRVDGTNRNSGGFPSPGVSFDAVKTREITYVGNDYGFEGRISIRMRFVSDAGWSDEDGRWPSDGAVQVDDITLTHSEGTFTEDYEGEGPYLFEPLRRGFFGDFSDVYPSFQQDLDPCRRNTTPVAGFIDYGQEVRNGPDPGGVTSTGGSTSPNWNYGIPGGFVVNPEGGINSEWFTVYIDNAIVSPPFDWDLPGTADDGAEAVGAFLRFDVWRHLPLDNAIHYTWGVRTRGSDGLWDPWDNSFLWYGPPRWSTQVQDLTGAIGPDVDQVQIRLHAISIAPWIYPGPSGDTTPAPIFDNVTFGKVRIGGPALTALQVNLAHDAFPVSGTLSASTPAERDALDVRFDMARNLILSGPAIVPGDSIYVEARALIPGSTVTDTRMKWALKRNLHFEDAIRSAPARALDAHVDTSGEVWTGEVVGSTYPTLERGRFFDLPDTDFLYPGDQLHYYFEATDDQGRVSTLPADLTGFGVWDAENRSTYHQGFVVRALPSIGPDGPPSLLVIDDAGSTEREELALALDQLGYRLGLDYDLYRVQLPGSGLDNGIGASAGHGATVAQLAGYSTILYLSGSESEFVLAGGAGPDYSDDLGVLLGWKQLAGPRHTVHFGDAVVSATAPLGAAGATYVQDVLGVALVGSDVRPSIDDQSAPRVLAQHAAFDMGFAAHGWCPQIRTFDAITPLPGAFAAHAFLGSDGSPFTTVAASVVHDRLDGIGDRKIDITFPFGLASVLDERNAPSTSTSARAALLAEVFAYLGGPAPGGTPTAAPAPLRDALRAWPNPFNPRTEVVLVLGRTEDVVVDVYDVRGARVATLHAGELDTGEHRFLWDGLDAHGHPVASGVYFARAKGSTVELVTKVALLR